MKSDAQTIIAHSIESVLPDAAVRRALKTHLPDRPATVIAIGKAAWRMARAACDVLGDQIKSGIVITKYGHSEGPIPGVSIFESGHPVPDANGAAAAKAVLQLADTLTADDRVLFLVSGGGSALFEAPLPGVTLEDIAEITRQLLACGANITEINAVRKHLSAVKGGRFALRCAPAPILSILLSDVLGDPLDAIASGPACPDTSTCEDVKQIIHRYRLCIPAHVLSALHQETPKTLENVTSIVTGNVQSLCHAAAQTARTLGYTPLVLTTTLDCEAREAGSLLAAVAREIRASSRPVTAPCAVILGGETVVHLRGNGKGGRNQELALSAARGIDGLSDTLIFSLGSDGTDGPTDAAGGMVTGEFAALCRANGLSIEDYLANNDAYTLLKQMDSLILTGPTGTNVNDLTVLLMR